MFKLEIERRYMNYINILSAVFFIPLLLFFNGCVTNNPPVQNCAKIRFETHGIFGWNELITTDAEKAKDFYIKLFGWTPTILQENYITFKNNEEKIAGIMENKEQNPYWLPYVTVDDIDKTAQQAEKLGAIILVQPTYAPDIGRFAILKDPQGAIIAIITYIRK